MIFWLFRFELKDPPKISKLNEKAKLILGAIMEVGSILSDVEMRSEMLPFQVDESLKPVLNELSWMSRGDIM